MKKITMFCALLLSFLVVGCGDVTFEGGETIPECKFDEPTTYTMGDIGLSIPSYTSTYFRNIFNVGGVIYNLNTVLDGKGDYGFESSKAKVSGKLISDGENCKGTSTFSYDKYDDDKVLASSVIINTPSNAPFSGEVSITIRTDDFIEQYTSNQAFYVRWRVVENDDNFVDGNLTGEKISYNPDFQSIYIPREETIYLDGKYQLISSDMEEPIMY